MGTPKGLSIYNGKSFVNKTSADGLKGDNVLSIAVADNTIYVGTDQGLTVSTDGGNSFERISSLPQINSISVSKKTVYLATEKGLYVSKDRGYFFVRKIVNTNTDQSVPTHKIIQHGDKIYVADEDGLWISTNDGVSFESIIFTSADAQSPPVRAVFGVDQHLYISTDKNFLFSPDKWRDV